MIRLGLNIADYRDHGTRNAFERLAALARGVHHALIIGVCECAYIRSPKPDCLYPPAGKEWSRT